MRLIVWLDGQPVGYVGLGTHGDRATAEMCESRGYAVVQDLFVEKRSISLKR
jgi:hypothetical protein